MRLREIAFVFLKLGTTSFGGPAAHIGMLENEVVVRRGWLSRAHFLDLMGAANLIPGPNSTELAIHIGYHRAGWPGLIIAGVCFIVPSACIVGTIAWAYVQYGSLPSFGGVLYGIKPVMIAIVVQAIWNLSKSAVQNKLVVLVAVFAALANIMGINEVLILLASGSFTFLFSKVRSRHHFGVLALTASAFNAPQALLAVSSGPAATQATLTGIWWFFMKVGSVLFGSGYVLLAFLRTDLVERWGWLTDQQLLDATTVGQMTPGPVFTTATFIGYVLSGPAGAIIATIGIFLPAFFFVAVSARFLPHLLRSQVWRDFLDGVNVASLALMVVVTWHLSSVAIVDPFCLCAFIVSGVLLYRYRLNSAWLIVVSAVAGFVFKNY